jgi:hypothetical protein
MKLKVLNSSRCAQPWEAMRGNARERYCESCGKRVHNFAAMTQRQVEALIREKDGQLCARSVYRADGELVTLNEAVQPSLAASLVLAASMACSAGASAQSGPGSSGAHLTGTVLLPNKSDVAAGALVALIADEKTVATAQADEQSRFNIVAPPGRYDILFTRNVFIKTRVPGAELHEGEQSVGEVPLTVNAEGYTTTVGIMVATVKYPASYLFKHPILYLKNLRHQL